MRLFDYTAHINEDGLPVLVMTIEVPLSVNMLTVPDELRHAIEDLIGSAMKGKKNDRRV